MHWPPALFIALWLLTNCFIVGVYDVYAGFFLEPNQSVSYWMQSWLKEFPVIGVALGVVLGHLAWPLHPSVLKKLNGDGG